MRAGLWVRFFQEMTQARWPKATVPRPFVGLTPPRQGQAHHGVGIGLGRVAYAAIESG
jgi:hypothetical protein